MAKILDNVELGIQSFCFREFTNEQICVLLQECGITALEICRKHLNLNEENQEDEVLRIYQSNSIRFNSFGINRFENNEVKIRPIFAFAQKTGIQILGAKPDPDAFDLLDRLCEEYSVKLAIHNHGRKDNQYGSVQQLEETLSKTSENIGLCIDTGWLIDAGEDPVAAIRKFGSRVYGIHFKDFSYSEDGERSEAVLGEGRLDLPGVMHALKQIRFNGYASVEYEGEPENPVPQIRRCIEELLKADHT